MKINELIQNFTIFTTNEENAVLDKLTEPCYIENFNERDRTVIENLIRKSLVTKIIHHGGVMIKQNGKS
jgi:hypothetical protein